METNEQLLAQAALLDAQATEDDDCARSVNARTHTARMGVVAAEKRLKAANLRAQAATNDAYARAGDETFEKTGRASCLTSAAQHRAAAEQKRTQADRLEAEETLEVA